jgi:hypothetical protein
MPSCLFFQIDGAEQIESSTEQQPNAGRLPDYQITKLPDQAPTTCVSVFGLDFWTFGLFTAALR